MCMKLRNRSSFMTDYSKARRELVNWIKTSLTGGYLNDDILWESNPFNCYTTGILYPVCTDYEMNDDDEDEASDEEPSIVNNPRKVRYQPPSSMGFSFYVDQSLDSIRVFFSGFSYSKMEKTNNRISWSREPLVSDDGEEVEVSLAQSSQFIVMHGRARIDVKVRQHGKGNIVTVSLSNISSQKKREKESERDAKAKNSIFQAELKCFVLKDTLQNYPRVSHSLLSEEEQELELRYKDERVYAIGHGVAVDWEVSDEYVEFFSDFMPAVEVPQVTANTGKADQVLSFRFLKSIESAECVINELERFVDGYEDWIDQQAEYAESETGDEITVAKRIVGRMEEAKHRMRSSISRLRHDELAKRAFAIANQAMLMQMELNGPAPDSTPYSWRPFQLAFLLLALESSIDEDNDFRDCVDLIWFPTGGGKTEAYLGVMALVFVYRRLKYKSSGGGTAAIMRYTLRLLTSQQFIRACKVVSALEIIRSDSNDLGDEPFSVGLWLGSDSSPNTFRQSLEAINNRNLSKFVLHECPWCSTPFTIHNYCASESSFSLECHNNQCKLGNLNSGKLPFNVVDEALYACPPTLLIATVDKFARLPWEDRAVSFFGGAINRPPELIIQDELHLISGALGSIVGLYEVGFESILVSRGVYPKFIASTATIRQAKEQVQALFGREKSAVFPPVGLRQKDSYFAKEVPTSVKPGRLYVGYMAFGQKRTDCLEHLAGALASAPQACFEDKALKDAWWTQMVYHGSLKGVGNSRTNFQSGVPKVQRNLMFAEFMKRLESIDFGLAQHVREDKSTVQGGFFSGIIPDILRGNTEYERLYKRFFPVRRLKIKSLTSNQSAEENADVFKGLKAPFTNDANSIDSVLATNMVSVGLDEPRLALMVINGQPLTTAEYIQASSRVGRGSTPGVVFTNYYKTQARSLSHYENFRAYHRSFYRFVEPSSITPFTTQVRKRALHAALVSALRHGEGGLLKNSDAENFRSEDMLVGKTIKLLENRIRCALIGDKSERTVLFEECKKHLAKLVEDWQREVESSTNLRFHSKDKSASSLLVSFEEKKAKSGLWTTLNSMRNVEKTGLFEVDGGTRIEE